MARIALRRPQTYLLTGWACLGLGLFALSRLPRPQRVETPPAHATPCPTGSLDDRGVCLPVPRLGRHPMPERWEIPPSQSDLSAYELPFLEPAAAWHLESESQTLVFRFSSPVDIRAPAVEGQQGLALLLSVVEAEPGYAALLYEARRPAPEAIAAPDQPGPSALDHFVVLLDQLSSLDPQALPGDLIPSGAVVGQPFRVPDGEREFRLEVRWIEVDEGMNQLLLRGESLLTDSLSRSIDPRHVLARR